MQVLVIVGPYVHRRRAKGSEGKRSEGASNNREGSLATLVCVALHGLEPH